MCFHSRQGTEDRPKKRLLASPTSLRAMLQMCLELGSQLILWETVTGIFKRSLGCWGTPVSSFCSPWPSRSQVSHFAPACVLGVMDYLATGPK